MGEKAAQLVSWQKLYLMCGTRSEALFIYSWEQCQKFAEICANCPFALIGSLSTVRLMSNDPLIAVGRKTTFIGVFDRHMELVRFGVRVVSAKDTRNVGGNWDDVVARCVVPAPDSPHVALRNPPQRPSSNVQSGLPQHSPRCANYRRLKLL